MEKIKIDLIDDFENHPYQVNDDEELEQLKQSIEQNGLLNPLVVRKKDNGRYELLSGHRRKKALIKLNIKEVDAIIKNLTDEEAIIFMVDSNMYREKILPSEKAFAYKMKLDAIKHQGKSTCATELHKSREQIANNESGENVRRYIRLTYLIPELLELVDNTAKYDKRTCITMSLKPAVELSYLSKEEQKLIVAYIEYDEKTPSHNQAKRIHELSKKKQLSYNNLEKIMLENKGNQNEQISFNKDKIIKVLPVELLKRDKRYIEQYIIDAIVNYNKNIKVDYEQINFSKLKSYKK